MIFYDSHMRAWFRTGYYMIWVVNNKMGYFDDIKRAHFFARAYSSAG